MSLHLSVWAWLTWIQRDVMDCHCGRFAEMNFGLRWFPAISWTFQCKDNSRNLNFIVSDPVDKAENTPNLPGNVSSLVHSFSSLLFLISPTWEKNLQRETVTCILKFSLDLNPLRPLVHRGRGVLRIVLFGDEWPPMRPMLRCRMELGWALSKV